MRPRIRLRRTILLALLPLLAGCGGFGYSQPEVTLDSVQIAGLGLTGGTLLVHLRVENPNRFSLTSNRLDYQLLLRDSRVAGDTAWIDFASGSYDRPFTVGGGGTEVVQIPVEFSYSGLGAASSSLLRAGTFDYRARGTVDVQTPIGLRTVPFAKRGTVTMSGVR